MMKKKIYRKGVLIHHMAKSSTRKVSSDSMSTKASKALQDGRTSSLTKSLAGSVLAQSRAGTSKKK